MPDRYNAARWLLDRHLDTGGGGRLALVHGAEHVTYSDLARQVHRVQHALVSLGVRPEERVAIIMNDEPAFVAWFLGCLRSGVVPVPLSTMLPGRDLGAIVDDARAGLVVLSAPYAGAVADIAHNAADLRQAVVVGEAHAGGAKAHAGGEWAPVAVVPWEQLDDMSEAPVAATRGDSPAFWLYSSGTTGAPKGVMHCHHSLQATATTYARDVLEVTPDDRFFSAAKLFFAFGLGNALTFPLSVGATAILDPRPASPAMVAETAARQRPTLFFGTPGLLAAMLAAGTDPAAMATVRLAATAGEALPADIHRRFTNRFGFPVLDGIGSTEALHIFLSNRRGSEQPGTSGTPVPGYQVRLLDADGEEVTTPGAPGYLHVRGPSIATGYWCRSEETKATFIGEWLRTGDVYERCPDGSYRALGRTSDMIKAGGIWVSPAEVEAALITHPEVLEAAVVGGRSDSGLELVVAFVVRAPGSTIDTDHLEAHCRATIAHFKRPRVIVFVDALPKTATGKIQRYLLRQQLTDAPPQAAGPPDGAGAVAGEVPPPGDPAPAGTAG